jgi:hypothetical protein
MEGALPKRDFIELDDLSLLGQVIYRLACQAHDNGIDKGCGL